jgi:hypothetical protein
MTTPPQSAHLEHDMSTLTDAVNAGGVSGDLRPLPLAHLTTTSSFNDLVEQGLVPSLCKVFDRPVLYLFYGGVFYRTGRSPTKDPLKYPIALLFKPEILASVDCYYPFDTGALASGRCEPWHSKLEPWRDRLCHRPDKGSGTRDARRIIELFYGTNAAYLTGAPPSVVVSNTATTDIASFLSADLTPNGVDRRVSCLECQFTQGIPMNASLIWVGFPSVMWDIFQRLCEKLGSVPEVYTYPSEATFVPDELTKVLENEARKIVERYDLRRPGSP